MKSLAKKLRWLEAESANPKRAPAIRNMARAEIDRLKRKTGRSKPRQGAWRGFTPAQEKSYENDAGAANQGLPESPGQSQDAETVPAWPEKTPRGTARGPLKCQRLPNSSHGRLWN